MKPWEDETLLQMIAFAQQNPEESLNPLRDRIQEMQYKVLDLMWNLGIEEKLIPMGINSTLWIRMRLNMNFETFCYNDYQIAIPFPDPQ